MAARVRHQDNPPTSSPATHAHWGLPQPQGAPSSVYFDQGLLFLDRDHSHALVGFAHGNTTRCTAIDHQQCLASKNARQCHGRLCMNQPGTQCGQQQR